MDYLAAWVAVVGTGLVINLLLTLALLHRLLRHGEQLARRPVARRRVMELPVGSPVPDFVTPAADGSTRSLHDLLGARSAIAFLSPGCQPCKRQLPLFRDYARGMPGGAAQVIAVFCTDRPAPGDLVAELAGTATIVVEPLRGTMQTAFSVSGYPTFYTLNASGRVEAGAVVVRDLTPAELV